MHSWDRKAPLSCIQNEAVGWRWWLAKSFNEEIPAATRGVSWGGQFVADRIVDKTARRQDLFRDKYSTAQGSSLGRLLLSRDLGDPNFLPFDERAGSLVQKKNPEKNPTYANFPGLRNVPRGSEGEMIPLATVKLDDFEVISADQYSGSPISLARTKQLAGHMDEKREALLLRFAFCFSCANNYSCALRRNETWDDTWHGPPPTGELLRSKDGQCCQLIFN